MTLLLRESDVRELLSMHEAVESVKQALTATEVSSTTNLSRRRLSLEHGVLNVMSAAVPQAHGAGLKAYSVAGGKARFLVALWDRTNGRLLAMIEGDHLGRMRTGAASAVATERLSRLDAATLTVIGCGRQGRTQMEAIAAVRKLKEIRVYCREASTRAAFASEMTHDLQLRVVPSNSPREAVDGADIISTVTTSAEPVLFGDWLSPGAHVNAAGSNFANRREVDAHVVRRARVIAVDSVEQARIEAGDLLIAAGEAAFDWSQAIELHAILSGQASGRESPDDVTLFKSLGVAIEDVAVARLVYDKAIASGRGENTTFGEGV